MKGRLRSRGAHALRCSLARSLLCKRSGSQARSAGAQVLRLPGSRTCSAIKCRALGFRLTRLNQPRPSAPAWPAQRTARAPRCPGAFNVILVAPLGSRGHSEYQALDAPPFVQRRSCARSARRESALNVFSITTACARCLTSGSSRSAKNKVPFVAPRRAAQPQR